MKETMAQKNSRPLDSIDLAILASLFEDARTTNKEIAKRVGLAPSSCLERIKRLQADDIIQGASLQVDLNALGGHIQAMISIRLSDHNRLAVDAFVADLLPLPEVLSLFHMGGNIDFLLHVSVADSSHLRDFVFDQLTARPEVNHVESALVYEHRCSGQLPKF